MLDTWDQRARRDGIVLKKISFPVPPPSLDDLADRLLGGDHAGDEGAALLPHHEPDRPDLPGQADLRRGAAPRASRRSSTARTPSRSSRSRLADLGCDYYGTSLHKWLLAPIGTGFLYVRREHIAGALAAARRRTRRATERHPQVRGDRHAPGGEPQRDRRGADVPRGHRQRAEGGAAALPARPLGRRGSRRRPAVQHPHQPRSGAVVRDRRPCRSPACRPAKVVTRLWDRWRIIATPIVHAEYEGVRVTPNVYTTLEEIDTFAAAMEEIVAKGAE